MNEYLVLSMEGFTIAPNDDVTVDNCQSLGHAFGDNFEEALDDLFEKDSWIVEAGFDKSECIGVQVLTDSLKKDIKSVVDYLWEAEQKHYEENQRPDDHIYLKLERLKKLL